MKHFHIKDIHYGLFTSLLLVFFYINGFAQPCPPPVGTATFSTAVQSPENNEFGKAAVYADPIGHTFLAESNANVGLPIPNIQVTRLNATGNNMVTQIHNTTNPLNFQNQEYPEDMIYSDCNQLVSVGHMGLGNTQHLYVKNGPSFVQYNTGNRTEADFIKKNTSNDGFIVGARRFRNGVSEVILVIHRDCNQIGAPATIYNFGIDVFPESATEVNLDPTLPGLSGNAPYYAITGRTANDMVFIFVVDVNGSVQFNGLAEHDIPIGQEVGYDIMQIPNGNLMVLGRLSQGGATGGVNTETIFLMELMTNSGLVFPFPIFHIRGYDIPQSERETGYAFVQSPARDYVIAGTAFEPGVSTPNREGKAFLMEVDDASLSVMWMHTYEDKTSFVDLAKANDGRGYFAVGDKWKESAAGTAGATNVYAVKTDLQGRIENCDCYIPWDVPSDQYPFTEGEIWQTQPVGVPAKEIEYTTVIFDPIQEFCEDDEPPVPPLPFECGMSVATCYTDPVVGGGPVAAIFDVRPNSIAPMGADWNDAGLGAGKVVDIHPPAWDIDTIGQVFGLAIDNTNGDIFLAATDVYRIDAPWLSSVTGPAGSGGIYKTPGTNVNITNVFVSTTGVPASPCSLIGGNAIPNSGIGNGNGIGNIAYDQHSPNGQLFATNTEDGRIYRLDMAGNILSIYDPFNTSADVAGIAPAQERIWGIGVFQEGATVKVYFARERSLPNNDSEIWSVPLDGAGEFVGTLNSQCIIQGTETLEVTVPNVGQEKVTDIAFSTSCRMLIAERGNPHDAHVYEYTLIGTNWAGPQEFFVGSVISPTNNSNSAGGVDYGYTDDGSGDILAGCDSMIWMTGNYMMSGSGLVYGLEGVKEPCNDPATNSAMDLYVDFDQIYNTQQKSEIGDVEVFRCKDCPKSEENCDDLMVMVEAIPQQPQQEDLCCYNVDLKNNIGPMISKVEMELLTPDWAFSSTMLLQPGFTFDGVPTATTASITHMSGSIPSGMTLDAFKFCLDTINGAAPPTQTIVFRWYKQLTPDCERILCTDTLVVQCTPDEVDPCVEIIEPSIQCDPEHPNEYIYCFKVVNNSGVPANSVILNSLPPGFAFGLNVPSPIPTASILLAISPSPLASGATSNKMFVKIISTAGAILTPTTVCFNFGLLDANFQSCCHNPDPVCVVLEPCCDPCEDKTIFVEDIMIQENACCKKIDIQNDCGEVFTKVRTEVVTPGVNFGYHAIGGPDAANWYVTTSGATSIDWHHNSGLIPNGFTDDIIQFCLDDIDDPSEVPQTVVLSWFGLDANGNEVILCEDLITLDCPPETENKCVVVSDQIIECDTVNQKYIYTFTVMNMSTIPFGASDVIVGIHSPSGLIFTPTGGIFNCSPLLYPGDSKTITTCIESTGAFPSTASEIIFKYRLAYFNGSSPDTCCFENVFDTIPLPDCGNCDELVVNGDFASSTTTMSDLAQNCTCAGNSYCIADNARDKCTNGFWQSITSPDNDPYMIIDGGPIPNNIWFQTVNVVAGTTYRFSFDFYPNVSGGSSPTLELWVDGAPILAGITAPLGVWSSYGQNWTATTTGSVVLAIRHTGNGTYNDFGIDNVSFTDCPCEDDVDIVIDDNPILTGVYHVSNSIRSAGTVVRNADVVFRAKTITLRPGFHALNGSDFLAKSDTLPPCDDCCPDDPLQDLPWLSQYVGANRMIEQCKLDGDCVYIISDCATADQRRELYDCGGNLLCVEGGIAGVTCDLFSQISGCQLLQACPPINNSNELIEARGEQLAPNAPMQLENYPNPFTNVTTIRFQLPQSTTATLRILDAHGKQVFVQTARYEAGEHQLQVNTNGNWTSGVYFYRLETAEQTLTKSMILLGN